MSSTPFLINGIWVSSLHWGLLALVHVVSCPRASILLDIRSQELSLLMRVEFCMFATVGGT